METVEAIYSEESGQALTKAQARSQLSRDIPADEGGGNGGNDWVPFRAVDPSP